MPMSEKEFDAWVESVERDLHEIDNDIYNKKEMYKPKQCTALGLPGWKEYLLSFIITVIGIIVIYIISVGAYEHE